MKKIGLLTLASCLLATTYAQDAITADSTGLPGDQFSLPGALSLFKSSESPEAFEKALNEENNHVNNLDLDNDGQTDYVQVIDQSSENMHAFILRVAVSESESQDIAVIELEKTGDETATIQIVGDEEIYGEKTVVEPGKDEALNGLTHFPPAGMMAVRGPSPSWSSPDQVIINVWRWPSVRFVFGPTYRVWVSPWGWRHHPKWWRPWRPYYWSAWAPICVRHRSNPAFIVVGVHRVGRVHAYYTPFRRTSVIVTRRYATPMRNYRVVRVRKGPGGRNNVIIRQGRGEWNNGRGIRKKTRRF